MEENGEEEEEEEEASWRIWSCLERRDYGDRSCDFVEKGRASEGTGRDGPGGRHSLCRVLRRNQIKQLKKGREREGGMDGPRDRTGMEPNGSDVE